LIPDLWHCSYLASGTRDQGSSLGDYWPKLFATEISNRSNTLRPACFILIA